MSGDNNKRYKDTASDSRDRSSDTRRWILFDTWYLVGMVHITEIPIRNIRNNNRLLGSIGIVLLLDDVLAEESDRQSCK